MSSTPIYGDRRGGVEITSQSFPALTGKAQALAQARAGENDPFSALIAPGSWRGGEKGNQFMAEAPPDVASRLQRIWGAMATWSPRNLSFVKHFIVRALMNRASALRRHTSLTLSAS